VAWSRPAGAVSSLPAACSTLASAVHPSFPPAVRVVGRGQPSFAAQKRGTCQPPVADLRQRWSAHVLRHVDPVPSIVLSRCLTGSWAARCSLLLLGWRVLFPPLGVDLCHDLGSAALRVRADPILCGPGTPSLQAPVTPSTDLRQQWCPGPDVWHSSVAWCSPTGGGASDSAAASAGVWTCASMSAPSRGR
jgi:hypothetical protein